MKFQKWIPFGLLLTLCIVMPQVSHVAAEAEFTNEAKASILMERDTGEILYEHASDKRLAPASLTKIMTLLLVMEAIENGELSLHEMVTVSKRAASMGGSQVFLAEGEQMKVEDLIKAVAIASANDASVALAERISGTEQAFVKRMNDKVKQLGLKNTKFQNASGLPAENHYTSAYDIAQIARELLKYETITNYTNIYEDYLRKGEPNEFWLVNTNKLVRFYPYVDGLKTGYTSEAKYCLVATAFKGDMRVISVVMGADSVKERNQFTMEMLDYALNQYEVERIYAKGAPVATLELLKGKPYKNKVYTDRPISVIRKKSDTKQTYTTEIVLDEAITLPVEKGSSVGTLIVKQSDGKESTYPIVVKEDIRKADLFSLMKRSLKLIAKIAE